MDANTKRYEVVNVRTGDRFGNHTYAEAVSRSRAMTRNWGYHEKFDVCERISDAEFYTQQ